MAAGEYTNVGDEGGFAPALRSAGQALDYLIAAIEKAGYRVGEEVALLLDPAASEFYTDDSYAYSGESTTRSPKEHIDYLCRLVDNPGRSRGLDTAHRSDRTPLTARR